jgi:hypothetical protein
VAIRSKKQDGRVLVVIAMVVQPFTVHITAVTMLYANELEAKS